MSSPWVASKYPFDCEIKTFEWPVFAKCFEGILRAGRGEPTTCRLERGYADLIESDKNNKWENGDLLQGRHKFILLVHDLKSWLLSLC